MKAMPCLLPAPARAHASHCRRRKRYLERSRLGANEPPYARGCRGVDVLYALPVGASRARWPHRALSCTLAPSGKTTLNWGWHAMSRRDTLQRALELRFVSGVHKGLFYAYAEARLPPRAGLCAHGCRIPVGSRLLHTTVRHL
jgi:hypothetical protein